MVSKKEDRLEDLLTKCRGFLRGKLDFVGNRNAVLMLVFLKFAQRNFIMCQHEIIMTEGVGELDNPELYEKAGVLYLETESTWNYVVQNVSSPDIALIVDRAFELTEKNNECLKGVFIPDFFSSMKIEPEILRAFIECVDSISEVETESGDIIGRVYEFFIRNYAMDERKIRGEYFTPKSIVELMVELIEPYEKVLYDPCFGTGGLFVQSVKLSEKIKSENTNLEIYGQEISTEIWRLAKLNLILRGIKADLGQKCVSVFTEDIHPDVKADFILANPPFNNRAWKNEIDFLHDKRFVGYDLIKSANANYGWILHIISKMSEDGVAGVILSNSAFNSEEDFLIRRSLVEQDKIEAIIVLPREMFYSTDISVALWIFNNNKNYKKTSEKTFKDRVNQVLFVDLRNWTQVRLNKNFVGFDENQIGKVKELFNAWRYENGNYSDISELCKSVSLDDIRKQNYNLSSSKYIDFEHKKSGDNFEKEMADLILELKEIKREEEENFELLKKSVESLGYEL